MSRQLKKAATAGPTALMLALLFLTTLTASSRASDVARTFASPSEAAGALYRAAKSGDQSALLSIFGPGGREVLLSGDPVIDQKALNDFAAAYDRMHRWVNIKAGGRILYLGAENFPFPIPLMQDAAGRWFFDTASGADEILARQIGRNELLAIAALGAARNGEGPLAQIKPGEKPQSFGGYYFRILPKPGERVILAYPSEYQNTGIMSFIVGQDGPVQQKDLGQKTTEVAAGISADNRGSGWKPVAAD